MKLALLLLLSSQNLFAAESFCLFQVPYTSQHINLHNFKSVEIVHTPTWGKDAPSSVSAVYTMMDGSKYHPGIALSTEKTSAAEMAFVEPVERRMAECRKKK